MRISDWSSDVCSSDLMRNELRAIQRRVGITFIYITHDQGEALTMSDRIAVMNRGMIQQIGDGRSIYETPRTSFVASFVGENNARSEEHTSELQSLMRISYAVFCLNKKTTTTYTTPHPSKQK